VLSQPLTFGSEVETTADVSGTLALYAGSFRRLASTYSRVNGQPEPTSPKNRYGAATVGY